MNIMIVEDHSDMRRLLKNIVTLSLSETVVFTECESGEEAVDTYLEQRPDCVLMDFRLGAMNGLEATEQIILQDAGAHVILVTSHDSPSLRSRTEGSPLKAFISKDDLSKLIPLLQTLTSQTD